MNKELKIENQFRVISYVVLCFLMLLDFLNFNSGFDQRFNQALWGPLKDFP